MCVCVRVCLWWWEGSADKQSISGVGREAWRESKPGERCEAARYGQTSNTRAAGRTATEKAASKQGKSSAGRHSGGLCATAQCASARCAKLNGSGGPMQNFAGVPAERLALAWEPSGCWAAGPRNIRAMMMEAGRGALGGGASVVTPRTRPCLAGGSAPQPLINTGLGIGRAALARHEVPSGT